MYKTLGTFEKPKGTFEYSFCMKMDTYSVLYNKYIPQITAIDSYLPCKCLDMWLKKYKEGDSHDLWCLDKRGFVMVITQGIIIIFSWVTS